MRQVADRTRALGLLALVGGPLTLLAVACLVAPDAASAAVAGAFSAVAGAMGGVWQGLFVLNALVAIGLAASPWGRARLGSGPPMYSAPAWVAVLVCTLLAGGGVFWVAAEPLMHLTTPPPLTNAEPGSREAAVLALAQSHVHWGFLAWAMVGTLGAVALAASHHLDQRPLRPSTLLAGWLGEPSPGLALLADAVAIVAVIAGTVGPIGFLALQLAHAAHALLGLPDVYVTRLVVLGALVALYTASAASGLQRGIAWLSRANVTGALLLGGALLLVGPTAQVVELGFASLAAYARHGPAMALYRGDAEWLGWWTVFYWGWFLGYAPMMSVFVARISRGRTVRELVLAVAVAAPAVTHLWFVVVGGTALGVERAAPGSVTGPLEQEGMAAALLATLQQVPGEAVLVPLFLGLVFCFLATTGDSVSYAISVVQSGRSEPPARLRVFWAALMGLLAAALLGVGQQGIDALQQFIVIAAVPVTVLVGPTLVTGPLAARRLRQRSGSR